MRRFLFVCLMTTLVGGFVASAQENDDNDDESPLQSSTFSGLRFRAIGPAFISGRVTDIAINPTNRKEYYVAVASGGVWKTVNSGTTWEPIFDDQASYSIGTVTLDPNNPLIVWVGTGENNSQRSVSYGDGVYKSVDGGKTWNNVGLQASEHIARIVIDPRDSDTVYVAAQGPLWNDGGDRGLYKTIDGGATWELILEISEQTGVTDLLLDPRDPDVLIAASYQRRRHVWTLIDGGPESALYKSTDGGKTWNELARGLPTVDLGRIGLAASPANPDVIYAIVEAADGKSGVFRSTDAGSNWEERSSYVSSSPQYYQELVADPKNVDRVYSLDTRLMVSEDGGATFTRVSDQYKHVDNHYLWIDPDDTDYLLVGCDGGIYESFDRGATWHFKSNLSLGQFYRVSVDNDFPFYNVFGGTQDNSSLGGPSRTTTVHGITNSDWFITRGGDGFETQVDPEDPNIIYAQSQHGGLVRFDRSSGERITIKPQPGPGEDSLRWNWDSPLIISPHSNTRLYFAANKVFRSEDRGNSWTRISEDLSRQLDRNQLEVMGRVQSVDAVAKNRSTSQYGNIVSLSESPVQEGLIYVGTDDGLIHVTEDGGGTWVLVDQLPEVPEMSYVSRLEASQHDSHVVYAAFDNHKMGDFAPYVAKSTDRGKTWSAIASDLPENGPVYAVVEDHVNPNLLFAGTEFGVFFTIDGGPHWVQLTGGIPTIAVRDLAIQARENDLALATFGRGFYLLDDYSPLRTVTTDLLEEEATLFSVKRAWMYVERSPWGGREKGAMGDSFFTAPNPPFGAVFTYYLKDSLETRKATRQREEREAEEEGGVIAYPGWDELRAEDREEEPAIVLTVSDEAGNVIRHLTGPTSSGFHRLAWDLRLPSPNPTSLQPSSGGFGGPPRGPMALPGTYTVSLAERIDGVMTSIGEPQTFETVPLGTATLPAEDREALLDFQQQTARLQRAVLGAVRAVDETQSRLDLIKKAIVDTPGANPALGIEARSIESRLLDIQVRLSGDRTIQSRSEPAPVALTRRVQDIVSGHWSSSSAPTQTHREAYRIAGEEFEPVLAQLRALVEQDVRNFEARLEAANVPWTPGRIPIWRREP